MRRSTCTLIACLLAFGILPGVEPWRSLPEETVFAVRVPDGLAFGEALAVTELGRFWTSEDRLARFVEIFRENASEDELSAFEDLMAKFQYQDGDVARLFAGPAGLGIAMLPLLPEEADSKAISLGWFQPEAGLSDRIFAAIDRLLAEQAEHVERFDEAIAGFTVQHYRVQRSKQEWEWQQGPDGNGEMVQIEVEAEPMLILVHRDAAGVRFASFTEEVGLERGQQAFGRFLSADGEGGFAAEMLADQAVQDALPVGVRAVEFYGNLDPLWSSMRALAERAEPPAELAEARKIFRATGLDQLSSLAYGVALDGALMRFNGFVTLPPEGGGLLALAEQPVVEDLPPAWVPADADGYQQLGFDFVAFYQTLVEVLVAVQGEAMQQQIQQMDQRAMMMLGTDVAGLLQALGRRLHFVTYPALGLDFDDNSESLEQQAMDKNTRVGIVFDLADEQLVQKAWQQYSMMLGMFMTPSDEQGFSGFRSQADADPNMPEFGLFLGHGRFVFAFGGGVSEKLLTALANPGEGGFVGQEWVGRAMAHLPVDGWTYSVSRTGTQVAALWKFYMEMIRRQLQQQEQAAVGEQIIELLPTADAWKSMLGVSTFRMLRASGGLQLQGLMELPLAPQ